MIMLWRICPVQLCKRRVKQATELEAGQLWIGQVTTIKI